MFRTELAYKDYKGFQLLMWANAVTGTGFQFIYYCLNKFSWQFERCRSSFLLHQELFVHVTKGFPWQVTTKRVMTLTNVRNLVHAASNALIGKAHLFVNVLRVTNWNMAGSIVKLQVRESCLNGHLFNRVTLPYS